MMEDKLENNRLEYIDYIFKRHGIDPDSIEGQLIYYAYGHGYHQAEKDLELTWEDVSLLKSILFDVEHDCFTNFSYEEFCKEILKRFNEQRNEDKH